MARNGMTYGHTKDVQAAVESGALPGMRPTGEYTPSHGIEKVIEKLRKDGTMDKLEYHEYADLFPMMDEEEFAKLVQDMRDHGFMPDDPIVLYQDRILDGRNRYRASQEAEVEPVFVTYTGDDPLNYVIARNLHRRHLSSSQRAALAAELMPMLEEQAEARRLANLKQGDQSPDVEIMPHREEELGRSREKAAEMTGTNPRYVQDAKKLQESDPELLDEVKQGKRSLPSATQYSKDRELLKEKAPDLLKLVEMKGSISMSTAAFVVREGFDLVEAILAGDLTGLEAQRLISARKAEAVEEPAVTPPSTPDSDAPTDSPDQDTPETGAGQDVLSNDPVPAPEKRRMTYFDRPEGLDGKAFWDRYFILANQQDEDTRLLARCGMFWLALGDVASDLGELLDLDNGQPVEHMRYFRHKFHEASVGTLCLVIHDDAGNDWRTTVLNDWSLRFYNDAPDARQFCVDALPVKEDGESTPERTESGQEPDTPPAAPEAYQYPSLEPLASELERMAHGKHLILLSYEEAQAKPYRWQVAWMTFDGVDWITVETKVGEEEKPIRDKFTEWETIADELADIDQSEPGSLLSPTSRAANPYPFSPPPVLEIGAYHVAPYPSVAFATDLVELLETHIPALAAAYIEQCDSEEEKAVIDIMRRMLQFREYDRALGYYRLMTDHVVAEEILSVLQERVPDDDRKSFNLQQEFLGHLSTIAKRQQADAESEAA